MLYARIAWFNFARYLAYPFEMVAAFVRPFITLGFTLLFWSIIASSSSGSIQLRSIIAYFFITTAVSNLFFLSTLPFGSALAAAVKSGGISYSLLRPLHVPFYYLAGRIGSSGVIYAVTAILLSIGLLLQPPASIWSVILFIGFSLPALAISYSLNLMIGTTALYVTEISGIRNAVNHVINIFSGTVVPLALFPGSLQQIAFLLPFAAAVYGPTVALRTAQPSGAIMLELASAYIWAPILLFVSTKLWHRSLRQYEAVGI